MPFLAMEKNSIWPWTPSFCVMVKLEIPTMARLSVSMAAESQMFCPKYV